MSALTGLFDSFDNLDQLNLSDIARWLKPTPNEVNLENYLANKILYPQTLPLSKADLQIDLAILREALRASVPETKVKSPLWGDNAFLNTTLRKILIPARFLNFVPNLTSLVWAFIDAFLLDRQGQDYFSDLWTIVLTDELDEVVGSLLLPRFEGRGGFLNLKLGNQSYKIPQGSLTVIPCPANRCRIACGFKQGKILGKEQVDLEVYGGRLGLVIDGRRLT